MNEAFWPELAKVLPGAVLGLIPIVLTSLFDWQEKRNEGLLKGDPQARTKYCERAARCLPRRLAIQWPVNWPFQASKCF